MNRRPSEVLRQNRDLIRSIALLHRTVNLRVFGSVLRDEDTETSDLDLLVDPLPGATLLDLGAIQIELEERLGISVDVLTPADLPKKFRNQVLSEAVPV
jgi:predicted nucleotidyltransferase